MSASVRGVLNFTLASVVILGGAWQLYCMSPAGAAEREQTRLQKEMAKQLQQQQNNTEKQSI